MLQHRQGAALRLDFDFHGGGGFKGYTDTLQGSTSVRRPSIATTDAAYFRYTVVFAIAMFLTRHEPMHALRELVLHQPLECLEIDLASAVRASRPPSPPASTSRSTSCGRSRWRRS